MSRALQINSSPQGWMARNTKPVPLAEKGWVITMKKISIILLSAVLVFSMDACNGGKEKADNQTEKQTESVKPIEEVAMATEVVTEVTTEAGSEETEKDIAEVKDSEEKTDKEDKRSADNETASKQEEKPKQNDEPEQKAPVNDNEEAGGNQSNAGNGCQTTDSPKDNVSNPQPASVAYSPQNVVSLATAKCQAGGMITTQQNLQNHLNDGSITQEEYNEYYPYDGMEGSYYSVFVETDLNKASTIDGQRLSSEDAIAEYIASMLLLETDPVFYISYDGVYTTGAQPFNSVLHMRRKSYCTRQRRIILTNWESKSSPLSNLSGRNTPIFWNKNGKPILPISRPKMI